MCEIGEGFITRGSTQTGVRMRALTRRDISHIDHNSCKFILDSCIWSSEIPRFFPHNQQVHEAEEFVCNKFHAFKSVI